MRRTLYPALEESAASGYQHAGGALPMSHIGISSQRKTSMTVLLKKRETCATLAAVRLQFVLYKLFTRVILNRISRTLDEGQPCEEADFGEDSARSTTYTPLQSSSKYRESTVHRHEEGIELRQN
ncbi:unnamed protein product [Heligmosomoides polygyrus]|uniref:Uncharacterized protein n=1 Tax=Heligmosomoides polygyrus TaxID=6339 RepID=A0A183G5Z9_HELPZ|nr:unnamed protein product [Heligmosomoides polygyrus]